MNTYFRSIESNLSLYESLKDSPALLELAIWKSKIIEQYDQSNDHLIFNMEKNRPRGPISRTQCRTDSLTAVMIIIVPIVFSFLTDGSDGKGVFGDNDDIDGDGYEYNDIDDCGNDGEDVDGAKITIVMEDNIMTSSIMIFLSYFRHSMISSIQN
jgi:hypothetical protein